MLNPMNRTASPEFNESTTTNLDHERCTHARGLDVRAYVCYNDIVILATGAPGMVTACVQDPAKLINNCIRSARAASRIGFGPKAIFRLDHCYKIRVL